MLLEDVKDILEGASGGAIATFGQDLFVGGLPATPDDCISLFEYGGEPPERVKARASPVMEYPRFQVLVRARRYPDARELAEEVYQTLEGFSGLVGQTSYAWIRSLQSPFFLDRDEGGRTRIACNYRVAKALSTLQ